MSKINEIDLQLGSQQIEYLQIGNGRLGQIIASKVDDKLKLEVEFARLDPALGLSTAKWTQGRLCISNLVICIAPSRPPKWQWDHILKGLLNQVKENRINIQRLVFISSTRVYDGIENGVVDSNTKPIASSPRAKSLIIAEEDALKLSRSCQIVRCSGLYATNSSDYQIYRNILKQTAEKPRFGVDIEMIASQVVQSLTTQRVNKHALLLTDGYCYFEDEKLPIDEALSLSQKFRILVPNL